MHSHHPGWRLVLWAWADVYPKKPERSSEAQAFQIKENIKWPFKNMMLEKLLKNTLTFNPWNTFLRKWRLTLTICGDTQKQSDLWPSFVPPQSVLLYLNCERSFWITWQNFNYPLWINKWVFFFLIFQPVTRKDFDLQELEKTPNICHVHRKRALCWTFIDLSCINTVPRNRRRQQQRKHLTWRLNGSNKEAVFPGNL